MHRSRSRSGRRRRSADEWARLIDRHEASGRSVAIFCLRESISAQSFYAWRRRLRGQPIAAIADGAPSAETGSAFVELKPQCEPEVDDEADSNVAPGGDPVVRVRFPGGCELVADAAHLPRLVTLLAAMPIPAGSRQC